MSMPWWVRPLDAVAGCACAAVLMILAGCTDAAPSGQAPAPTPTTASSTTASAAPASGDSTPSRATTAAAAGATGRPTPSRPNQPPVVRSIRSDPEKVNPLDCAPPDPAERPEVIVEVVDPDDPVSALEVWLQYSSGPGYQGNVRMRFDPSRHKFVYRLPPVTRAAVGNEARNITIAVQLRPSTLPPPLTHWIPFKSYCLGTIGNG